MEYGREQEIIKEFGKKLKEFRDEIHLSTRQLADKAGLDYGNINEIENGKKNPTLTTIVLLAEALEIHPGQLFAQ
jgi:transcriptional regulator with XRE-family HTH domain